VVSWQGAGPFAVLIDEGRGGKAVVQAGREIVVPIARISGSRFAVIVTDARKSNLRIVFELRKVAPEAPNEVKARDNQGELGAVWLASQQNGAWQFEAVSRLRALPHDKVTAELISALEKGWQPK